MVRFAKALAANTDLASAQAFIYPSSNLNFACLISGLGDDVFSQIRQSAYELESKFFEMDADISSRLEQVLKFLNEQLKNVENLEILLICWQENVLYIKSQGLHQAYLYRDGNLTNLTSDSQSQLLSGHLQVGDKLMLLSNSLERLLNNEQLQAGETIDGLIGKNIEEFEEEVNELSSVDNSQALAGVLIDYHSDLQGVNEKSINVNTLKSPSRFKFKLQSLVSLFEFVPKLKFLPKKRKIQIITGVSLILILVIGAFFLNFNRSSNKITSSSISGDNYSNHLQKARDNFSLAKSLQESDGNKAKEALLLAKQSIAEALKLKPNEAEALGLQNEIKSSEASILKIYQLDTLTNFLDLNLVKKDFSARKMSQSLGKILLLDEDRKTLISFDLKQKNNQILAGETQLGDAKYAALNGDFAFIYSKDKGILRLDTLKQKTTQVVKPDSDWGNIIDIYGFAGNIYLLDNLKNQIWKYLPTESSYSGKRAYLNEETKVDFADVKRFHIDQSIWVLKNSEVLKFIQGALDNFSIEGVSSPLGVIDNFFTSEKSDNLYFLDKNLGRIIVLDKKGQTQAEYMGEKLKEIEDFIVDEEDKKVYLLQQGKITTFDLK
ncbi:hypothetical protein HYS91_01850 [Candidatus Daviesbacteria bacterium]|nr:hypothetical protein [Candidatus Daviesbacteria bacterium]